MKADERMQRLLAIEAFVKDFRRIKINRLKKQDGLDCISKLESTIKEVEEMMSKMTPVHKISQINAIVDDAVVLKASRRKKT